MNNLNDLRNDTSLSDALREQGVSMPPLCVLRLPEVMRRVGLCRASIYQRMPQGTFPKSLSLGARTVGWLESEIDAWILARMKGRT